MIDDPEATEPVETPEPAEVAADAEEQAPQAEAPQLDEAAAPAPHEIPVEPSGPRTVGRYIADALRAAGVRVAFTVPGESFLGVLDALGDAGIRVVATRHEGGAAFMAEAYGQLTGRPAACLATRAVGAANLAIGIHTARQDSTPMFALVGQVQRDFLGREAFQEVDQVATIGGLAKWAAQPMSAEAVPAVMAEAVRQALGGRPGPVLLALPEDLLDGLAPEVDDSRAHGPGPRGPRTTRSDPSCTCLPVPSDRSSSPAPASCGRGRRRSSSSSPSRCTCRSSRVGAAATSSRTTIRCTWGWPVWAHQRSCASAWRPPMRSSCSALGSTSRRRTTTRSPGADTRWIHVDVEPRHAADLPQASRTITADARTFLKAANEILDRPRRARRRARRDA